jgi:N-acetylmuramoyl-L-alanine amidase
MPAALVEMGFMSNPAEERLLSSSAHQKQIVDSLVDGIVRFREYLDRQRQSTAANTATTSVPPPSTVPLPSTPPPVQRTR